MYMDMQQSEAFTDYFTQVTEGRWGKDEYPVDRTPITAGTDLVCCRPGCNTSVSLLMDRVTYPTTCHLYMHCFTFPRPKLATFHVSHRLLETRFRSLSDSETFAQWTNTKSATLTTLKTAEAIATVGIRMIIDRPWAADVKKDWEDNMARLDGHNVRKQVEEVFESYPLNPDVDRMVCACH
jgi:hypothetical protein